VYIPAHFLEDDTSLLQGVIREYSFATLVTCQGPHPFASHLPFLLDADRGDYGTLRAHMARANPQWQDFENEQEALAMFQGPHAYISPSWYEAALSVPTWNYVAVHAYGVPRLVDETCLHTMLQDMVATYEAGFATPWKFDLPDDYVDKMLKAVVGFEIEITRLEGKFKLSQNRPESDCDNVREKLRQTGEPLGIETAAWMERRSGTD
jgi:transcriptional regulator